MSHYGVLYYPKFEPSPRWLRSTLLFVDTVNRIVPVEAEHVDSKPLRALRDAFDDDLVPRETPQNRDLRIDQSDTARMRHAFQLIAENHKENRRKQPDIRLGFVFIHYAKIPPDIRKFLEKSELVQPYMGREPPPDGYIWVENQAGSLILSYVADRIARRKGIDAITDFRTGFTINALENQGIPFKQPLNFAPGCLVSAIATCQVPYEITYLSLDAYKELRASYEEIRETFQALSIELAQTSRLAYIEDLSAFEERLTDVVDDFNRECERHSKTKYAKKIKKWGPWGVGTLLNVASSLVPGPVALAGKVSQVVCQLVDKKINKAPLDPKRESAYQMLCDLRENVVQKSLVKRLLKVE